MRARPWPLSLRDLPLLVRLGRGVWAYERRKRSAALADLIARFDPVPTGRRPLDVDRTVRIVTGVLQRIYVQRYCLPRSLLLYDLLRGAGLPVQLHVGVRRVGEALDGHAWVDLDGVPVGEAHDPRQSYSMTLSHPPAPTEERAS